MARRENNKRQERNKFYIITNGKETECNYFTLLKSKKSIYDVKIEFKNSDPQGLVEYARLYVNEANQIWVVFDVDNSYEEGRLTEAIRLAKKFGVRYAFSNIAFEVWLINHFRQCSDRLDTVAHKRILDEYLDDKKRGLKYEKNDEDILKKYFVPNYKTAVENAKIVYQKRKKENIENYGEKSLLPIWEWNSCTTVFMLVEALKLAE